MGDVDAAGLTGVEDGAARWGEVKLVGSDVRFVGQAVRSHHDPFDGGVLRPKGGAQVVGGVFVVGMGRKEGAQQADDAFLPQRDRLVEIAIAVAGGVHEDEFDRRARRVPLLALRRLAQPARGIPNQPSWIAKEPGKVQRVAQATGDGVAARQVFGDFPVAKFEDGSGDDRQSSVASQVFG